MGLLLYNYKPVPYEPEPLTSLQKLGQLCELLLNVNLLHLYEKRVIIEGSFKSAVRRFSIIINLIHTLGEDNTLDNLHYEISKITEHLPYLSSQLKKIKEKYKDNLCGDTLESLNKIIEYIG